MKSISVMAVHIQCWAKTVQGRRVFLISNALLLCIAIALVFFLGHLYGTRYYTVWPDETLFSDIAEEFVTHGIFGAPSFDSNGLRMSEKTYFMPPLYPLSMAAWFRFFSPTIANARVLSNLFGTGCLVIIFLLALKFRRNSLLAGIIVLCLALDTSFVSMFNFARPDILALTFSFLAVLVYFSGLAEDGKMSRCRFLIAWMIASAGMLTHPIGGAIGFLTIPIHLFLTNRHVRRDFQVWGILAAVPMVALLLWGLYIVQDVDTLRAQFFDWQTMRKTSRYTGLGSYLWIFALTFLNYGAGGTEILGPGPISTILTIVIGLRSLTETDLRRPSLLVLILTFVSAFVVYYGKEGMYPPLRLPAFYLAFILCVPTPHEMTSLLKPAQTGGIRFIRNIFIAATPLLVLASFFARSCLSTRIILREVNGPERSVAYDPSTLARQIIANTAPNSSLAIKLFPDCYDILIHSGYFKTVRQLSYHSLSRENLVRHVLSNDYLAITYSALEPRTPGRLIDFSKPNWGGSMYREIAKRYYHLKKEIVLPGGGTTLLYQRNNWRTLPRSE
ncbi:MAG: glycosyltransferase family 39 protein [Syntrophobacterales bacterium]|jgi:hypothetical protein|nr:glycosyltransferase family 39 protein [Syntrophobacterales bacterium]